MSESFIKDLRALQEQKFASPRERYSAWQRLIEDPRAESATSEERYILYAEAALALNASSKLKEPDDLAHLVALTRAALESAPREQSVHGIAAINFSGALAQQAALSHKSSDWEACHEHARSMLHVVPQRDWRYPLYLLAEATVYYELAIRTDDVECADHAIASLRGAKSKVRIGSGIFGTTSAFLADICLRKHYLTGDVSLLEEAIRNGIDFGATDQPRHNELVLTLVSLCGAFLRRFNLKNDANDISRAVAFSGKALEVATTTEELAEVHAVRGSSYRALFEYTHDGNALEKALDSYSRALELYGEGNSRDQRTIATLLDNYANGLCSRYRMLRHEADLQASIGTRRKVLELLPADDPFGNRGRILTNLGKDLLQLARDLGDLHALTDAEGVLREALSHIGPDDDQISHVHMTLADLFFEAAARSSGLNESQALERALSELDAARKTIDHPLIMPADYELGLGGVVEGVAERQVGTMLRLNEIAGPEDKARWLMRALWAGESAKAGLMAQELLRTNIAPPPEVPDSYAQSEQLLLANLARLEAQELRHRGAEFRDPLHIRRMQRRAELCTQLQDTWSWIASFSAEAADYVALRRGRTYEKDKFAVQKSGVVCLAVIPFKGPPSAGTSSFGTDTSAKLGASNRHLAIIATWAASIEPAIAISAGEDPIPDAVHTFVRQVPIEAEWARLTETWHDAIVPLVTHLAEVVGPADELLISPSREGFSLPWHLVVARADWKTRDGCYMPITTVPTLELVGSMHSQISSLTRWHVATDAREFNLDDPEGFAEMISVSIRVPVGPACGPPVVIGDPLGDLRGARGEANTVARVLGVKPLVGSDASSKIVLSALSEARVMHLATHVRFNSDQPLNSLVYLADRNLTVGDLLGLRSAAELIVLSACESGLGGNLRGEEILGLANILLRCGTREVIASLWRVDDEATEVLMSKFHECRSAVGSATALAAAMTTIRNIPKWSDPYYWAGFILLATGSTVTQH